jgi:hypothetical protein
MKPVYLRQVSSINDPFVAPGRREDIREFLTSYAMIRLSKRQEDGYRSV